MKKNILLFTLIIASQVASAVHLIERNAEEITKIADQDHHMDIKFTLGSTFAGYFGNEEIIGGKSGVSLAWFQPSGVGQEFEYIWNPIAHPNLDNVRQDMIFANLVLLSSFHSQHIRPHIAVGLGWAQITQSHERSENSFLPSLSKQGSVAAQIKAGYEREIAEGLSWGLDYGYIRTLHELRPWASLSNLGHYHFKTQFVNSHISLRF